MKASRFVAQTGRADSRAPTSLSHADRPPGEHSGASLALALTPARITHTSTSQEDEAVRSGSVAKCRGFATLSLLQLAAVQSRETPDYGLNETAEEILWNCASCLPRGRPHRAWFVQFRRGSNRSARGRDSDSKACVLGRVSSSRSRGRRCFLRPSGVVAGLGGLAIAARIGLRVTGRRHRPTGWASSTLL